ncbi:MAG: GumC family protein [Terriglobales bacterium]
MDQRQLSAGNSFPVPYEPPSVEFPTIPLTSGYYPVEPPAVSIWEYLRTLYKHRWLILAAMVIVTTLATIATLRMTPIYEATGRIEINRPAQDILPFKDANAYAGGGDDDTVEIETQVKILQSDGLAADVARRLSPVSAAFLGIKSNSGISDTAKLDVTQTARSAAKIKGGLTVATVPRTRLVDIRFASPNPQVASEVVNNTIDAYIEHNIRSHFESTMQASEWLSKQLTDLRVKAETTQQRLVDYQKQKQIIGVDEKQNVIVSKLDELNKELTQAESERIQKEANFRIAQSDDPEVINNFTKAADATLLNSLKSQESTLKTQIAQLQVLYGPSHPKMLEARNQLVAVEGSIQTELKRNASRLKADYQAALQRESMLRREFENQKTQATQLNENAIEYTMLRRDADTSRQLYDGLLQKLKEAQVSAGLNSSNVRVVDGAAIPSRPARPDKRLNIMLGLLLGLASGIGLAFLIESLDTTVSSPEEAEAIAALPSLGVIPLTAGSTARKLLARSTSTSGPASEGQAESQMVAHFRPRSQSAEAYRALRTSLLLSGSGTPPKVVVITSPLPQEGKTSTAINTAVVLTQTGARVLLVDCDLRRPSVHRALGMPNRSGVSTLLATGKGFDSVVIKSPVIENLYAVPAGPPPPQPAELLASKFFQECLTRWKQEYDHVVIDTPPVLSVTDAVVLSVHADAVVLVVRSDVTTKNALRQARDLLVQVNARITGTLLNGVDLTSPGSYYYYYSYGYGQKNRYYNNESRQS